MPAEGHRFNATGIDGLRSRPVPGRAPKLTKDQMTELRQLVIDGPDPTIHKVMRWRCLDLRAEVARRFSVTVDEITIGRWLGKMGLRLLKKLQPSLERSSSWNHRGHASRDLVSR